MVRSPGFGSNPVHLIALFRLAFTVAPPTGLTLRTKLTRWIVLQKARRHRTSRLRLLVGTKFQDLFHSPPGVLFTFPSLYLFTIDRILQRLQLRILAQVQRRQQVVRAMQ